MEDHDGVPSAGKQPCGVGAGEPGFGPNGRLRGGGGCSRSGEGGVSTGGCFAARLVWLAAGRSPGSGGAQGRAGRRAASRMPGPGPARVRVCTVGRCKACARHGPDARRCRRWGRGTEGQRRWVKIQHKTRAQAPAPRHVGPGDRAGAQG